MIVLHRFRDWNFNKWSRQKIGLIEAKKNSNGKWSHKTPKVIFLHRYAFLILAVLSSFFVDNYIYAEMMAIHNLYLIYCGLVNSEIKETYKNIT